MNFFHQLSFSKFLFLLVVNIHLTFGQNHTSTLASPIPANSTENEMKRDSNVTWIKIATITSNDTDTQHRQVNCTIVENTSTEDQNLDTDNGSRRRRRKRRRNKYRSWNQARRQPENSYKKHSTRVQLNKPVQFLIPPDYQENLIAKESNYYANGNERENFIDRGIQKKIPPPVRYLLPPFFDPSFVTTAVPQREPTKKSKYIEWSPSTTNRGSTKFKHTVYYSDSGNEILSNYQIVSTTSTPRIKSTTATAIVDDRRAIQTRIEPPPNTHREYRPIVVQPTPSQYYTTQSSPNVTVGYTPKELNENRVNNFLSTQVARAGMQVVNMSAYQTQQSQFFQNQYYPTTQTYKQFAQPTTSQVQQPQPQHQQQQQINYQQYQQMHPPHVPDHVSQISYQLQNQHLRPTPPTYNQPPQNYQHQTTYSRPPEIRTTPAVEFTTVRTTTTSRSDTNDNFKGLEIAESKYFSDLPSEQEFTAALQNDGQVIPGIAGKDYPVFDQALLQKRRFACRGLEGYFADVTSRCQVFYICNGDGAGEPMLCPNGTLFSQELLVCDWWYNVDC